MTCIVGWVTQHEMVMGADAASVSGSNLRLVREGKVFQVELAGQPALFACCGSGRLGQVLRTAAWAEIAAPSGDLFQWVVRDVVGFLRAQMKAAGLAKVDNNREDLFDGGSFLLATRRRLFEIWTDAQVAEASEPYSAGGSGRDQALGALHALAQLGAAPLVAVERALGASAYFNAYVRGPFTIKRVVYEPVVEALPIDADGYQEVQREPRL